MKSGRPSPHEAAFRGPLAEARTGDRKTFALAVQAQFPQWSKHLFLLLDGKPIRPLILRTLDISDMGREVVDSEVA